nr:MAG TPA: hypothetical protein [Caudoviricetes sp.]
MRRELRWKFERRYTMSEKINDNIMIFCNFKTYRAEK